MSQMKSYYNETSKIGLKKFAYNSLLFMGMETKDVKRITSNTQIKCCECLLRE